MADYQNPQQDQDAAGSTQMFRAFVDDGTTTARRQQPAAGPATTYGSARGGSRTGLIAGVVVALVVVVAVVWMAVS